nr:hypothetical protein Iba_chr14dCG2290 [Ipomoea batatas]GME03008.1 hypothetical protein Iba_scaffold289CG0010 [Ipomoea batatas]
MPSAPAVVKETTTQPATVVDVSPAVDFAQLRRFYVSPRRRFCPAPQPTSPPAVVKEAAAQPSTVVDVAPAVDFALLSHRPRIWTRRDYLEELKA